MEICWTYGKTNIEDCVFVRKKVFVIEQGFDETNEFDGLDAVSYHLLLRDETLPAGTARLYREVSGWHCGRICLMRTYRGKKLGRLIMEAIEEKAAALGADTLALSAQLQAVPFYEKAGYQIYGAPYMDEHCPHIMMRKTLF